MRPRGGASHTPRRRLRPWAGGAGGRRMGPGTKEGSDEDRIQGRVGVVDPVRGGRRGHEGVLRPGRGALRRSAPRAARRPGGLAQARDVPLRQRPPGLDRGRDDGAIVGYGQEGGGVLGSTLVGVGRASATFRAVAFPELRPEPEVGDGWVRFRQTAGGRTGVPQPRRVSKAPFVQYLAPPAWSTLALTLHADGRSRVGARGRQQLPPPLGLRPGRRPGRQDRPHRLQGLVPRLVRRLQPVGRRGLARAR